MLDCKCGSPAGGSAWSGGALEHTCPEAKLLVHCLSSTCVRLLQEQSSARLQIRCLHTIIRQLWSVCSFLQAAPASADMLICWHASSAVSLQYGSIAHLLTTMVCQAVEATAGPHSAEQAGRELPRAS